MKGISRRTFLKAISSTASMAALGTLLPRFVYAQAASNLRRNVVLVNLNGGIDGLGAFPIYTGLESLAVNSYRPDIHIPASEVIKDGLGGRSLRGLHPSFSTLHSELQGKYALIQQIGIPIYPGASHGVCQKIYSIGEQTGINNKTGFIGKVMDERRLDSFQVLGLGVGRKRDFITQNEPPLIISSLASYNHVNRNFGTRVNFRDNSNRAVSSDGIKDSNLVQDFQKRLDAIQEIDTDAESLLSGSYDSITNSVAFVQQIATQAITGNYNRQLTSGVSTFGNRCKDAAKVLRFLDRTPSTRNKSRVIYLEKGGWDTHGNQVESHRANIDDLGSSLRGLVQDLKAGGAWNNTVIYVFSEFGRTTRQNGGLGTDHAYANTHLLMGGRVRHELHGAFPLLAELLNENRLSVDIDFRRPLLEIFNWAGFNVNDLIEEAHDSTPLGLFT